MPQGFQNMLALNVAARQFNETIGAGLYSLTNGMLGSRTQAAVNQDKSNYIQNIQNKIKTVAMSGDENKLINILKWAAIQLNGVDKVGFDAVMDMYKQFQTIGGAERKIILQGGIQYYADTGEKVLKNVSTGRKTIKLADDREYWINLDGTLELVKPDLVIPKTPESLATELVTSFGYAGTLEQMEELVKELIEKGLSGTEIYKTAIANLNVEKTLRQDVQLGIRTDQRRLSDRVSGSGIPEFEVTLSAAEAVIEMYAGKDIPGIGAGTLSITDDAKVVQSAKSALINTILKIRSGAAVTDPEFNRLQEEIAGKWNMVITDEDFRRWVKTLRSVQDRIVGAIFGGYRPEVKEAYWAAGGFKVKSKVTPEELYKL